MSMRRGLIAQGPAAGQRSRPWARLPRRPRPPGARGCAIIAGADADDTRGFAGSQRLRWRYDAGDTLGRWRSVRQALAEKGFFYVARLAALWACFPVWRIYCKVFPRGF